MNPALPARLDASVEETVNKSPGGINPMKKEGASNHVRIRPHPVIKDVPSPCQLHWTGGYEARNFGDLPFPKDLG